MKREIAIRGLISIILSLSLFVLNGVARGDVFCVNTPEALQIALNTSATNGKDDTIKIVQGNYIGNFTYNSSESHSLRIEGGYNAGCISRVVNPENTVLDANGSGTVLQLIGSLDAIVDGITLQNGSNSGLLVPSGRDFLLSNCKIQYNTAGAGGGASLNAKKIYIINNTIISNVAMAGGGVDIQGTTPEIITFSDNFISQNITNSAEGGGIHIKWGSPTVNFVNNVISRNATTIYIGGGHGGGAHISTYGPVNFINNTVVENTANLACCWGGGITIYYASYANVYNNIFWGNNGKTGRDITFYSISESNISLLYNDIDQTLGGVEGLSNYHPSNLNKKDPLFIDSTNDDFHLQFESPCIDKGTNVAPELPATDKDGNLRIANGIVDMGAYEYSINIDILPDDDSNTINLRRTKKISVAILSTPDFDAPSFIYPPSLVEPPPLTFGPTGVELSFINCTRKPRDVNKDGLKDLICNFSANVADFQCGDTEGVLKGETATGISFEGRQSVVITPCN